tara:strand:- start:6953 stop:8455 length:1503 start_codon:yes stop_codon:yes gene_type:complete
MPENSNLEYSQFQWHFGVVEDRNDPMQTGRVKVRFHGVHTDNKGEVKTEDLPWATVVNSPNNAATTGVGGPVTGIVEGSWVIGFFMDQGQYQKPMVLGTISGMPTQEPVDKGFNDPNLIYPKKDFLNEPDITRLARSEKAETHISLLAKRASRVEKIATAKAPSVTIQDDKESADYENKTWDEPHPRGYAKSTDAEKYPSKYPLNHVRETETGHIQEFDDSPSAQRIHLYHSSGTFEEIQSDGSRSTKIVGSDYEITVKDKNIQVAGNLNITVNGDAKLLIKGDKYEEIDGNYFLTVRKDKIEKIQGNHLTEILTDKVTQINGNTAFRVGDENTEDSGHEIRSVLASETITVGGSHTETINGDTTLTILQNRLTTVGGTEILMGAKTGDIGFANNFNAGSAKNVNIKAKVNMQLIADLEQSMIAGNTQTLTSATQDINADTGTIDYATTGSIDLAAGNITVTSGSITDTGIILNSHTHTGPATAVSGDKVDTGAPVVAEE